MGFVDTFVGIICSSQSSIITLCCKLSIVSNAFMIFLVENLGDVNLFDLVDDLFDLDDVCGVNCGRLPLAPMSVSSCIVLDTDLLDELF